MAGAVIRRLDDMGRIVLPSSLRGQLGLAPGTPLAFFIDGDRIILRRHASGCVVCGKAEELVNVGVELMCRPCLRRLAGCPEGGAS